MATPVPGGRQPELGVFAGLGAFGPSFLDPYARFIGSVVEDPSPATYSAFLEKAGAGKVPAKVEEAGLAFMLANPVEEMDEILERAVQRAEAPESRERIREAKERYQTSIEVATEFAETPAFEALPPRPEARRYPAAAGARCARDRERANRS